MKKPSLKLDKAKLKDFLAKHVEKFVLGIVVLLMAGFVYKGYSLPGLGNNNSPVALKNLSETSTEYIRRPETWPKIKEIVKVDADLSDDVEKAIKPNDDLSYRLGMPWKKPDFPRLAPRVDPQIFAPIALTVTPIEGPLAYFQSTDDPSEDALAEDMAAEMPDPTTSSSSFPDASDLLAPKPVTPKRASKRSRPAPQPGMPTAMPAKASKRSKAGRKSSTASVPSDYTPSAGSAGPLPSLGSMPSGGMGSSMYGAAGGNSGLYPEATRGYRPQGEAAVYPAQAMVIMAVVPFEKQSEEFETALSESLEYDPLRDSPRYLLFNVERADVTGNTAADPSKLSWQLLDRATAVEEIQMWSGSPTEVMDPSYLDPIPPAGTSQGSMSVGPTVPTGPMMGSMSGSTPHAQAPIMFGVLTHPAPPFLLRDNWALLTHPDVPLMKLTSVDAESMTPGRGPRAAGSREPGKADEPTTDLPSAFGSGSGAGSGPTMSPYGASKFGPPTGMPRMGPGMGPGMGMGMGMGMSGSSAEIAERPKYKLIRYTDMSVERGHEYRYRLKVLLEDPNHPSAAFKPPPPQSLKEEVQTRVKELDASDAKRGKRTYWRQSEWSEASAPAKLPNIEKFFALQATPSNTSPIVEGRPKVPNTQPSAKVLAVVWNPEKAADLAAEVTVHRGSLVAAKVDADAIHPAKLMPVKIKDAQIETGGIIADINGGDDIPPLKKNNDKPLKAPAEMLIFDAEGRLLVENETDDIDDVRKYMRMKVDAKAADALDGAPMTPSTFNGILDTPGMRPRGPGPSPLPTGPKKTRSKSR